MLQQEGVKSTVKTYRLGNRMPPHQQRGTGIRLLVLHAWQVHVAPYLKWQIVVSGNNLPSPQIPVQIEICGHSTVQPLRVWVIR